ncbi:RICIN domain-containing protein [Streptomyces sp. NPDC048424]|uniref:RICIN domain-containing protein n=1 Tax=Streptomyces sp. NPDC048424 TaxID=3155265 RepID=UPI003426AF31
MTPGHAEADVWHQSTRLTNLASGLDASIQGRCDNQPCINGKGLALGRESGNIFGMVEVAGGRQIRWFGDWCLDVDGTTNGTPVVMHKCADGATGQFWTPYVGYSPMDPYNAVEFVNVWSGKCMDARNPSVQKAPPAGAVLQIWDCNDAFANNQRWIFHF